ncbi:MULTISPECIES: hypothetical protein [Acidithiobacillus]|uniref:Uncharacterized protein n=2 Tax=Acidithiobacillus TaxID=119977 RepID=A0A179B7R9_ACIFR|nr:MULTISPECIES: hypothetical protein [Acidithiobacillus]MEB8487186.1 hypothetical protein [Acidithiobacillus ferriphilus]MEB8490836.1 hypothetical protein [Acidithiobacillus ferriphilus]MEB8492430.1 hypothetical protein [Acidithiobacillus ferriphilus]MEB8513240.1 hypothetical protein [Acidithiobacillus ferriphilus]MEB8520499.1 hypothetical protein [Acidithiobacillus ferriphilus]
MKTVVTNNDISNKCCDAGSGNSAFIVFCKNEWKHTSDGLNKNHTVLSGLYGIREKKIEYCIYSMLNIIKSEPVFCSWD